MTIAKIFWFISSILNKSKAIVFFSKVCLVELTPKPINKLKSYPAKHPVTAITPYPYLANA